MRTYFAILASFICFTGHYQCTKAVIKPTLSQPHLSAPLRYISNVISPAHTPDPAAIFHEGYYYGIRSKIEASDDNTDPPGWNCWAASQDQIIITKSRRLEDIFLNPESTAIIVDRSSSMGGGSGGVSVGAFAISYTPGQNCPSMGFWAPSLKHIDGRWFIFATGHRPDIAGEANFALENTGTDPMNPSTWHYRGMLGHALPGLDGEPIVLPTNDHKAATVTLRDNGKTINGQLYFIYSHNNPYFGNTQQLNLVRLQSDHSQFTEYDVDRGTNMTYTRVWSAHNEAPISFPLFDWEMQACRNCQFAVNEGPTALYGPKSTFILYSASFCATKYYSIGMLEYLGTGKDGIFPFLWAKYPRPVFSGDLFDQGHLMENVTAGAFGIGHNQITVSPDYSEQWIVYHAKTSMQEGPQDREARIQRFAWRDDGSPDFLPGPIERNAWIKAPSESPVYALVCSRGKENRGLFCVGVIPGRYTEKDLASKSIILDEIQSIQLIGGALLKIRYSNDTATVIMDNDNDDDNDGKKMQDIFHKNNVVNNNNVQERVLHEDNGSDFLKNVVHYGKVYEVIVEASSVQIDES